MAARDQTTKSSYACMAGAFVSDSCGCQSQITKINDKTDILYNSVIQSPHEEGSTLGGKHFINTLVKDL